MKSGQDPNSLTMKFKFKNPGLGSGLMQIDYEFGLMRLVEEYLNTVDLCLFILN